MKIITPINKSLCHHPVYNDWESWRKNWAKQSRDHKQAACPNCGIWTMWEKKWNQQERIMTKKIDVDIKVLRASVRALDKSSTPRMLKVNMEYLYDRYIRNPPNKNPARQWSRTGLVFNVQRCWKGIFGQVYQQPFHSVPCYYSKPTKTVN